MHSELSQKKKLRELRKGDIIHMYIPFEENTTDYYNGYTPQEIRGELYTDRNGKMGKSRYVVVIGHENDSIQYLPLTSRHARFDSLHQYQLEDNSMTHKKDPNMKSYVEVDSLRSVYVDSKKGITYQGRVAENDMIRIMSRLTKRNIDFESDRDQRVYVSRSKEVTFENRLKENGYLLTDENNIQKIYEKSDGRTVTKTKWGLAKYHVPLSKEEVSELIAKREGRPIDDFSRAVADISNKEYESEVMK